MVIAHSAESRELTRCQYLGQTETDAELAEAAGKLVCVGLPIGRSRLNFQAGPLEWGPDLFSQNFLCWHLPVRLSGFGGGQSGNGS